MQDIMPRQPNPRTRRPDRAIDGIVRNGTAPSASPRGPRPAHTDPVLRPHFIKIPKGMVPGQKPTLGVASKTRLANVQPPLWTKHAPQPAPTKTSLAPPAPAAEQPVQAKPAIQPERKTFAPPPKKPRKHAKLLNLLSYPLIVVGALLLGTIITDPQAGQWVAVAAGVVALVLRVNSRYLFAGALLFLIGVVITSALKQEVLADAFAVYAYLLLVFGTLAALVELRSTSKYRFKKQRKYN